MTHINRTFFLNDRRKTKNGTVMSFKPTKIQEFKPFIGTTGFCEELTLEEIVELLNQQSQEIERKEKVLENFCEIRDREVSTHE
jgi:hypothetical protein